MVLWAGFCIIPISWVTEGARCPSQCSTAVVTTVSIDIFSLFTTNIEKECDPSRAYRTREPATSLCGYGESMESGSRSRRWPNNRSRQAPRNAPLQHRPDPFQTTCRQFVTGGFL